MSKCPDLVGLHVGVQLLQHVLPLLELAVELVHLVNPPEVVDLQLWQDVLLPVESDEWNLQELLPHKVEGLFDFLHHGVLLALPVLAFIRCGQKLNSILLAFINS